MSKAVILALDLRSSLLTYQIFNFHIGIKSMKTLLSAALSLGMLVTSSSVFAKAPEQVPSNIARPEAQAFNAEAIKSALESKIEINVMSVRQAPMPGLAEVFTDQGLFYSSLDGSYIIKGTLFGVDQKVSNLTEFALADLRVEGMGKFSDSMIVYPAKDEKHVVTVYTDYTCTFCRKLHAKMDQYNKLGITIRYLPYPRFGIYDRENPSEYSENFQKLRSIWCHEDPNLAMDKAKESNGQNIASRICEAPIEANFNFARQIGVSATPAIVFENGFLLPGFREPADLKAILETL